MFNPIRRNRNIGATQGGRVKHGHALEKWSREFGQGGWSKLSESNDEPLQLIRQNPSRGFYHPCSLADFVQVMATASRIDPWHQSHCAASHLEG